MTADTSAVVAALSAWHEQHEVAAEALAAVTALPAHAMVEAYSVMTRLPSGLALPPSTAAELLATRFDRPVLRLDDAARAGVIRMLATAGVFAGATYDGLVGLEATAHESTLLTLDQRAQETYRRLGVAFRSIGP